MDVHPLPDIRHACILAQGSKVSTDRRTTLIRAMEMGCDTDAGETTIFNIRLDDMDDREIRIAAKWLATMARIHERKKYS